MDAAAEAEARWRPRRQQRRRRAVWSSYLAVVCQRIPPGRVLRALTVPLLRGLGKVQLLTGWRWRGEGEGWERATMKLTRLEAEEQTAPTWMEERRWVGIRSEQVAVFAVLLL